MDCSDNKGSNTTDQQSRKSLCINQPVIWDVSTAHAVEILQDMGVSMLEDDLSLDSCHEPESTPQNVTNAQQRASCKAPRAPVAHSSINNQQVNTSLSSPFSRVADDFVLFRRSRQEGSLGKDHFSQISDEIILQIFKWLPKYALARCAQVSKRWKGLAYDESLWKRVDLGKKHLQPGVLGMVIDRGVIIMRLCMSEVKLPVFDSFSLIQKRHNFYRYSKLQYLDLSMVTISLEGLNEILSVCQQLRKLSLEHCRVNSDICCHIGLNTNLETLNMAMCEGLNAEGLQSILCGCRRLESWNLGWTHLSPDCIQLLVHSLPHSISHLNLSGCRQRLVNEDIATLVHQCCRLQTLDISDATFLTNEALDEIIKLEYLEHLHVSRCYSISPAHYLSLKNMSSLCRLDVFGVLTDTAIQSLRANLPHIEINRQLFSIIARPTTGIRRTSIWELRVRD
ncbi:S-phase kinase-associated protein 2-like [Limulus polyphemus]|uniref:S-phase kinase-associated protein 2-like n=1 Tax=Limulus polyphemus TaxID=6850 RepID=A0ABM1B4Y8_LIMPO|nr:S-phase kinase-associated protein 2-like [Limulus polyphemus]